MIRYGLALLMNRLPKLRDATVLRARNVRIEGPVGQPVQSDGDLIGQLPLEIALGELRLLVPDVARVLPARQGYGPVAAADGMFAGATTPVRHPVTVRP